MGELVGIDPLGAEKLIRQMEAGKDVLAEARPGLDTAITETGARGTGSAAVTALQRGWAVFHESQQYLTRRVATLTPWMRTRQQGMLTGTLPSSCQTPAAQAATKDAAAI